MGKVTTTSVERALDILEFVARAERGQTNSDISRRLDIPKSSASYLLRTLESRGYLRRDDESGRYRIGIKVIGLGQSAIQGLDIRRVAEPILRELVEETGLTGHLAILDHGRAVYIDRAEKPGFLLINTWVGRELTVHSTGVGKVLVMDLPLAELDAILERDGLPQKTPKTITTRAAMLDELERVRKQGYAVDDEENNLGVRCVAVPIYDQSGRVLAAFGLSGPTSHARPESVSPVSELMRTAASRVSRQLGYAA